MHEPAYDGNAVYQTIECTLCEHEANMLLDSVSSDESTSESDIDIAVIIKREMDDEKNGNVLSICFGLIET